MKYYTKEVEREIQAKRLEQVLRLYESGKTMQEIADRFGVTRQRVQQWLAKAGYSRKRKKVE